MSRAPKLTPWFPPEVKPVRKGWYARDFGWRPSVREPEPQYWNGTAWFYGDMWPEHGDKAEQQNREWRGILK
jgi:hypothetical protein